MPVWEDTPHCSLCNVKFSVAVRRHHCRPCGRCVCNDCSPSSIVMDGLKGMQRVCTPCISASANIMKTSTTLAEFGATLHLMCGVKVDVDNKFNDFEDALEFCKTALGPLQDVFDAAKGKCIAAETTVNGLENTLRWAEDQIASVAEQLYTLVDNVQLELESIEPPMTLTKAVELCTMLVKPVKQAQAATLERALQAEMELAKEREARYRAEALLQEADTFYTELSDRFKVEIIWPTASKEDIHTESETIINDASDVSGSRCDSRDSPRPEIVASETSPSGDEQIVGGEPCPVVSSWEEDLPNCSVCGIEFSALTQRRHHCRICGKCVCASCSPSSVQVRGYAEMQRACTPCIGNAQSAPEMLSTTVQLATRLNRVCGMPPPAASQFDSLGEALAFCETALTPLEEMIGGSPNPREDVQGESMQLHLVQARAENFRVQRTFDAQSSQLESQRAWAQWVHQSTISLQKQVKALHDHSVECAENSERQFQDEFVEARVLSSKPTEAGAARSGFNSNMNENAAAGEPCLLSDVEDSEDEIDDAAAEITALRRVSETAAPIPSVDRQLAEPCSRPVVAPAIRDCASQPPEPAVSTSAASDPSFAAAPALNFAAPSALNSIADPVLSSAAAPTVSLSATRAPSPMVAAQHSQAEEKVEDRRHRFGVSLVVQRCSVCQKVTLNRGSKETGERYCIECYDHEFPKSNVSNFGKPITRDTSSGSVASAAPTRSPKLQRASTGSVSQAAEQDVDRRYDFGIGTARCSQCRTITLNRGDERSLQRYCLRCYNEAFPFGSQPEAVAPMVISRGRRDIA